MFLLPVLRWLLTAAEVAIAVPILYLAIVSLAATAATAATNRRRSADAALRVIPEVDTADGGMPPRFAVVIPAHDEETVLAHLLESLEALDYPRDHYDVCVIADNCTDRTADVARDLGGVQVYERQDEARRGKGYALNWAFQQLASHRPPYDAYVVFDADSVVDPRYLTAMAGELAQGACALQGCNTVRNTTDSPSTVLRWLALTLMNHIRPLGRNALGASSTLTGNGMCLSRELLLRHPWQAFGATEDRQYSLVLAEDGERVRYVPDAVVRSEMPTTFASMRTQDVRWGSGVSGQSAWQTAARLVRSGLQARDLARLEAAVEQALPPLSVLVLSCTVAMAASLALWSLPNLFIAFALWSGLLCYVGSAFYSVRLPRAAYRALLYAPGFMAWKVWIYFVLRRRKHHAGAWVRTRRASEAR